MTRGPLALTTAVSAPDTGRRPRVRAPELAGRGWLNTGGATCASPTCAAASCCSTSGPSAASTACTSSTSCGPLEEKYDGELVVVGRALAEVRARGRPGRPARRRRALRGRAPGPRRPGAGDLAGLHRPGLADAGARRPGGLRRRAVRRRGPRPRHRRARRRAARGAPGQGHAAARRLAVRRAARPGRRPAVPGQGGRPARRGLPGRRRRAPRPRRARGGRRDRRTPDRVGRARPRRRRPSRAFNEPNGLCLLPDDVAAEVGYDVVVADTVNHALRGVHLATGDGQDPGRHRPAARCRATAPTARCRVPWDVAWWQDRVWVAMAGVHQLWTFDPRTGAVEVAAGTANEGLLDGPLADAWFAQTSGLAADRRPALDRGQRDLQRCATSRTARCTPPSAPACSTSASRTATRTRRCSSTRSGSPCCPTGRSRSATPTTAPYVAGSRTAQVTTIATGLAEPSGAVVDGDHLVVVESAAHRLTRVPLAGVAPGRRVRAHHAAAGHRDRRRGPRDRRRLHPAARAEGRRPVRAAVPAVRVLDAARR